MLQVLKTINVNSISGYCMISDKRAEISVNDNTARGTIQIIGVEQPGVSNIGMIDVTIDRKTDRITNNQSNIESLTMATDLASLLIAKLKEVIIEVNNI